MTGPYKAAFVIPVGATKILEEDGWEFESSERLSKDIGNYLIEALKLTLLEEYSGIMRYAGESIGMSVIFDDDNEVEIIYFQLAGEVHGLLSKIRQCIGKSSGAEIFVP